ncbi:MAG: alpha/beta hydrolase-fold protein [Planctomycetaceae bacterium]
MIHHLRNILRGSVPLEKLELQEDPSLVQIASGRESILNCWHTKSLDGRRVDIFVPQIETPPQAAVLFLHGHGRVLLNENLIFSRLFQQHGLVAVCPDGGRSWWLDVLCREFDTEQTPQHWLVNSVVPFIERSFSVTTPRIALLGVSMGGQGVLQLAFRYATKFPVVAAIAPAVDFYQLYGSGIPLDSMFSDKEAARQASVVLNLHPLAWPRYQFFCCDPADTEWFDGAALLGMKLSSSGILHERDLETSGGGHSWDYMNRMAGKSLNHIADSLRKVE